MKGHGTLRIHLLLIIGLPVCLGAGGFELSRALSGHDIAWVYTVEWPVFAIFGVYMWWQLYHEHKAEAKARATGTERPVRGGAAEPGLASPSSKPASSAVATSATPDAELAAWQRYLSNLHAVDPPGRAPGQDR
jgi:hypothetical protein